MNHDTRRFLLNLTRVLVSAGLLTWVISRSGLEALFDATRDADLSLLAGAYALAIAGMFIRTARWLILLRAVGARVSFWRALYLYFVGGFFNVFLPTGLGGDVLRVLEIGPGATSEQATGTVLVDRLTGFIALFVMALVALPFSGGLLPRETATFIGLLAGGVCVGALLLFEGRLLRRLLAWASRFTPSAAPSLLSGLRLRAGFHGSRLRAATDWLARTYDVITTCGWRAILGALSVATVYNLSLVWANLLIARSLGLGVSAWHFLLFTPVAVIALLVPISIAGLGVREGIYVTLFGQVGLTAAQATVLSLGAYSLDAFVGLLGGGLYFVAGVLGMRMSRD